METIPADCKQDLYRVIDMINPGNLLVAGVVNVQLLADLAAEKNVPGVKTVTGEDMYTEICGLGMYDLVILADVDAMPKKTAMQVIGRIRDFHARHFLVMVQANEKDATSEWHMQDFIACGMRLFKKYATEDNRELRVYRFELSDYKITPEWFNSKFWANPELFDKYRW